MFFKTEVVLFIYNAYLESLSVEEIAFKTSLNEEIGEMSWEDINEIIDSVNRTI
jgi:hypothetical protein